MSTRIYIIQARGRTGVEDTVLVEASSSGQALRHVVKDAFETRVATTKDVARYIGLGCAVHVVGTEDTAQTEEQVNVRA